MPTIQKVFVLEVTPEKFVDSCTDVQLQEVIMLAEHRLSRTVCASPEPEPQPKPKPQPAQNPQPRLPKRVCVGRPARWTPENVELLRTMSVAEAAAHFGLSKSTICTKRSKLGVSARGGAGVAPATPDTDTDTDTEPAPVARRVRQKTKPSKHDDDYSQFVGYGTMEDVML
jgi:hypothetical protein